MEDLSPPTLTSIDGSKLPSRLPLGIGAIILTVVLGVGIAIGGEVGQMAIASLNALPFAVLAVLAYLGGRRFNWAWVATGLWMSLLIGGAAVVALGFGFATVANIGAAPANPAGPPQIAAGGWLRMGLIALGTLAAILASAALLLPQVRRRVARAIPIDPDSFVHTVALVSIVSIGMLCTIPLLVLGQPPLLALVSQMSAGAAAQGRDSAGMLRDQVYSLVWTIPAALLAVGYGTRRRLPEALQRLGLVRPTWRQALAGVAIALLLVGAVQLLSVGISWLWGLMGWPITDDAAFGELLSFAISPVGAVVIGITAGLGEELAVRGALQPRLGILVSNLFFMSLHALQYNWDALLVVFIVGLVCGVVRKRSNTSTSAIVHGVYNFTLIMLSLVTGS
ncbi:CPBP family intramembrane metalloprotease [Oscillochloris sp. ZM17-4]|uniref:CPBP family intramembrane glutamic endopeptidase n=1 Tax=Oscillochloris sp. ZM17-4 TaxID=2866714 RepID=UPI001C72B486|nr:CPBP family intramembrane glutamic endopeptidase [Oscillochloris sp. ZM17-4]MBX0329340.1 CPBP family intramembrane metalloprotease [Oscillochloris sp. ZM17-4]